MSIKSGINLLGRWKIKFGKQVMCFRFLGKIFQFDEDDGALNLRIMFNTI